METQHCTQIDLAVRDIRRFISDGAVGKAVELAPQLDIENPNHANLLLAIVRLAVRESDYRLALKFARTGLEKGGLEPQFLRLISRCCMALDDLPGAEGAIDKLLVIDPTNLWAMQRRAYLFGLKERWDDAAGMWYKVLEKDPNSSAAYRGLFGLYFLTGRSREAVETLKTALLSCDLYPKFSGVHTLLAGLPLDQRVKLGAEMARKWPEDVHISKEGFTSYLPSSGSLFEMKLDVLNSVLEPSRNINSQAEAKLVEKGGEQGKRFLAAISKLPTYGMHKRPVISPTHDVVMEVDADQSETLVIYFGGLGDNMPVMTLMIDAFCAKDNYAAAYLQDKERTLFLNGLSGVSGGFDGALAFLRSKIERHKARRVITIGTSGGGYSAIKFGLALRADRILGFSAPTTLVPTLLDKWRDDRGKLVHRRLTKMFDTAHADLNADVAESGLPDQIHLYYGADMELDRRHAEHLSGHEAVKLYPIPGLSLHLSLDSAIADGSFAREMAL